MKVILSLGSNIGDKKSYLKQAISLISRKGLLSNIISSSFYETEPVGFLKQDWFMNMVISGECIISPLELFDELKSIELDIGRINREKWHEREIDIDIIIFGNKVINSEILTIPHQRFQERKFVLLPLSEIEPDLINPVNKIKVSDLLECCSDTSTVRKINS